jgi:methylated-DNA-protein-cysteine methyltransferase-like protein
MKEISNIKAPSFYERCYEVARRIPYGKVTSYGAIAKYLGAAMSSRMVGWAMNNSHDKNVPAHRVVNRIGILTGKHHFAGSNLMKELLQNEGHTFEGDQLLNFNQVFWKPNDT